MPRRDFDKLVMQWYISPPNRGLSTRRFCGRSFFLSADGGAGEGESGSSTAIGGETWDRGVSVVDLVDLLPFVPVGRSVDPAWTMGAGGGEGG